MLLPLPTRILLGIFPVFKQLKFLGLSLRIIYGGKTKWQSREVILKVT